MAAKRFIAIDWSGRVDESGQRKHIWIADWYESKIKLVSNRTREEVFEYLIAAKEQEPRLVAGFDFAFSYPAWFVREQGCHTAADFWQIIANGKGEDWLRDGEEPFWGRPGRRRPEGHRLPDWKGFRQTDREIRIAGIEPKSPFQIGGAGAVGTGSLRGIPILNKLHHAGFSIWPFTEPGLPVALEIYPRIFTGKGNKSSQEFRTTHLAQPNFTTLAEQVLGKARQSEDAFDALCSVVGISAHAAEFALLQQATDPKELLEGKIWAPASPSKI